MLKILSSTAARLANIIGLGPRSEDRDAKRLYAKVMMQSRQVQFYGETGFADSYDGRMEVLCAHLAVVDHGLRQYGVQGERLAQALYDVMIADFDIALREESLSDTAIVKRIKPLAKMYFERLNRFAIVAKDADPKADTYDLDHHFATVLASSHQGKSAKVRARKLGLTHNDATNFSPIASELSQYCHAFSAELQSVGLGNVALGNFEFPQFIKPAK